MIALQTEDRCLPAHQWLQFFAYLLWENKFAIGKFRYALAVLAPDTEESMALLFEFLKTAGGLCIVIIFIERLKFHAFILH